jgi:hypothetical protein
MCTCFDMANSTHFQMHTCIYMLSRLLSLCLALSVAFSLHLSQKHTHTHTSAWTIYVQQASEHTTMHASRAQSFNPPVSGDNWILHGHERDWAEHSLLKRAVCAGALSLLLLFLNNTLQIVELQVGESCKLSE